MEGLDRRAQTTVLSAFDREVLSFAFRASEIKHTAINSPVEDISRLLNKSDVPSIAIKASNSVMKTIPAISFELAEADPTWLQNLFLEKAAQNFVFYRNSLLEEDESRPSGMKIKPEIYDFLASVNTGFDRKLLAHGIDLLWKKFNHEPALPYAVEYDSNIEKYDLNAASLFDKIRLDPNGSPSSYKEFETALNQQFNNDSKLAEKIRYLGEEAFADDFIWGLIVSQGMYEANLSSIEGTTQSKFNAAMLQLAETVIRGTQSLADKAFLTDPEKILSTAEPIAKKLANNKKVSFIESFAVKAENTAFLLMLPVSDSDYKKAMQSLYKKSLSAANEDTRDRLLNNLLGIENWISSHREVLNDDAFLEKLRTLSEITDASQLSLGVKHFIALWQMPSLVQTISRLSAAESIGGQLVNNKLVYGQSTSTEGWTSLSNRGIYFQINNTQIVAGSQSEADIFVANPNITEQEKAALKLIDQRFIHLEKDLISARTVDSENFFPQMSPSSIKIYSEQGQVYLSCVNAVTGFEYLTPEGPTLTIACEAECHSLYQFNSQDNRLELIGSSVSGQDAERVDGLLYGSDKQYQSAVEIIKSYFKQGYSNQLSSLQRDQEAKYGLAVKLSEFEFLNKGPKSLFVTNFIKNLRALYKNFYDQDKSTENIRKHLSILKGLETYLSTHQSKFGDYAAEAYKLIATFEINIASSSTIAAKVVRKEIADSIIAAIQAADRIEAHRILANYQDNLKSNPALRQVMTQPNGISRYVTLDNKSTTRSDARILKAAKDRIKAASKKVGAAPLSVAEKALLAVERKKWWASRELWLGVGLGLAAGALIGFTGGLFLAAAAPVVVASIAMPVVGAAILGAAATVLGYFGYRTPKKAAKMAFKAPKPQVAKVIEQSKESVLAPSPNKGATATQRNAQAESQALSSAEAVEHHKASMAFGSARSEGPASPPQPEQ